MNKMKPKRRTASLKNQPSGPTPPAVVEEGAELRLRVESERDFFLRVREVAKKPLAQAAAKPIVTLSFQSATDLLGVLTPKRHALFDVVRNAGPFESIEDLAQALVRDRAAVSRDLKALADAGLLSLQEVAFPGHGRRTRIEPVASRIRVELML